MPRTRRSALGFHDTNSNDNQDTLPPLPSVPLLPSFERVAEIKGDYKMDFMHLSKEAIQAFDAFYAEYASSDDRSTRPTNALRRARLILLVINGDQLSEGIMARLGVLLSNYLGDQWTVELHNGIFDICNNTVRGNPTTRMQIRTNSTSGKTVVHRVRAAGDRTSTTTRLGSNASAAFNNTTGSNPVPSPPPGLEYVGSITFDDQGRPVSNNLMTQPLLSPSTKPPSATVAMQVPTLQGYSSLGEAMAVVTEVAKRIAAQKQQEDREALVRVQAESYRWENEHRPEMPVTGFWGFDNNEQSVSPSSQFYQLQPSPRQLTNNSIDVASLLSGIFGSHRRR